MIHVIVNQRPLGTCDGFFDRLQLLGDLEAGFSGLDHPDYRPQMSIGPFQTGNEGGMACMNMGFCHKYKVSPQGGYDKSVW